MNSMVRLLCFVLLVFVGRTAVADSSRPADVIEASVIPDDWVRQPGQSRILMAPLSRKAGGWGQIKKGVWATKKDPAYQKMAELVEASISPLEYTDIKGTCGRAKCVCGCCWVRKLAERRAPPVRTE